MQITYTTYRCSVSIGTSGFQESIDFERGFLEPLFFLKKMSLVRDKNSKLFLIANTKYLCTLFIISLFFPLIQVQIYNQYGQFVRKFGANILQHPRGVTVDNKGRIIVVECKVMRVIIFDQGGNVLNKFGCSKHLEFPNGVVVNDRQEIFISDNRAHCVKVFNYEGVYLRQIGGEGNKFVQTGAWSITHTLMNWKKVEHYKI